MRLINKNTIIFNVIITNIICKVILRYVFLILFKSRWENTSVDYDIIDHTRLFLIALFTIFITVDLAYIIGLSFIFYYKLNYQNLKNYVMYICYSFLFISIVISIYFFWILRLF
jgi:hypothetical protein